MKLHRLAAAVVLALTAVASHAQDKSTQTQGNFGIYFNPLATRVSNSVVDTGPFAYLGPNTTSRMFWGFNMGGYYDFFHSGSLATGFDVRFSDSHGDNAALRNLQVGLRLSASPFKRPIRPFIELAGGAGTTKPPAATVKVRKPDYAVYGGADWSIAHHIDFRMIEVGYGSLTTASSATIGAGGNIAIPSSKLLTFSSGLVFRF